MASYTEQLLALHAATLGGGNETILPLIKHNRADEFPPEKRIAIYRNGYRARLTDAVHADFSALSYYIGEDACRKAIGAFIAHTPSASWDLTPYSYAFPAFLSGITEDATACDIAATEGAIAEIFRMKESVPIPAPAFAALGEDGLEDARFSLRHASRLLELDTCAHEFIRAFRKGEEPDTPETSPQYLCIVRHENEVRRLVLDAPAHAILTALHNGATFGNALESAVPLSGEEALAAALPGYIGMWLENGVLCRRD